MGSQRVGHYLADWTTAYEVDISLVYNNAHGFYYPNFI